MPDGCLQPGSRAIVIVLGGGHLHAPSSVLARGRRYTHRSQLLVLFILVVGLNEVVDLCLFEAAELDMDLDFFALRRWCDRTASVIE